MKAFAAATAVTVVLGLGLAAPAGGQSDKIKAALDTWLTERTQPEGVTGITAAVSFPDGRIAEAFAGRVGKGAGDLPVTKDTLLQIGSVTKSMTAGVLLTLEAAGRLSIDDTVGKWLTQSAYEPAWKGVTIRQLLNMTAPIPTYSETEAMSKIWINEPQRVLSAQDLVGMVKGKGLPVPSGWFYSNTNYILAGMIATNATRERLSLPWLMREQLFRPLGLDSTFYEETTYPEAVMARLAHGYFLNPECSEYQPKDCTQAWNKPLLGRDMRTLNLSWAQAAGGAISNARDTARWARGIFNGRLLPNRQQAAWLSLVSQKTGKPIDDVSADDPRGFALGLGRIWVDKSTAFWFYEGTTLGYRTMYVFFELDNLMIAVQTNSQPKGEDDKLRDAIMVIYKAVKP